MMRGLYVGFTWVWGNGNTSRTTALVAAYHHPRSLTWRWGLYWLAPSGWFVQRPHSHNGYGGMMVGVPIFGGLMVQWQPSVWEPEERVR